MATQLIQLQDRLEDGTHELLAQRDFDDACQYEEFVEWARDVFQRHEAREPWVVMEGSEHFFVCAGGAGE